MPFFKLDEMPGAVVAPGHSTAYGPTITGEVALILSDHEHEQIALEEGTRFVSFKTSTGQLPDGE